MMPRCEKPLCESALLKKKIKNTNKQNKHPTGLFPDRQQRRESERVVEVKLTKHSLFSPLPHGSTRQHCVPTQTTSRWRVWQINPVLFFLSFSYFPSKSEIHTSFQTWDMHFCSNIYPVSTLKVKICVKQKENEIWTKNKKWGLKRIGVRQCKWTLYKVKERGRELERGW